MCFSFNSPHSPAIAGSLVPNLELTPLTPVKALSGVSQLVVEDDRLEICIRFCVFTECHISAQPDPMTMERGWKPH